MWRAHTRLACPEKTPWLALYALKIEKIYLQCATIKIIRNVSNALHSEFYKKKIVFKDIIIFDIYFEEI